MSLSPISAVQPPAPPPAPTVGPGRSAQSVGHLAKTAVAEARAAGVELPRNAQGMAASRIARGADPASVFAALVTPPEEPPVIEPPVSDPPVTELPVTELPVGGTSGEETAGTRAADPPSGGTLSATGTGSVLPAAEAALALLQQDA